MRELWERTKCLRNGEPSKGDIADQNRTLRDGRVSVDNSRLHSRARELRSVGFGRIQPQVRATCVHLNLQLRK